MMRLATFQALLVAAWALVGETCLGQAAWEFTPYAGRVWIALAPVPELPANLLPIVSDKLRARSQASFGAILDVRVNAAPAAIKATLLHDFAGLDADRVIAAASSEDLEADKIYVAAVRPDRNRLRILVREFDCRTRQLGPAAARDCGTAAQLSLSLWDALAECFTPLARIEQVGDSSIVARLRAGGLATSDGSPALLQPGAVLRPVLRRNDRTGQPVKGGIQAIGWTFFSVDERRGAVVECTQRSGYRAAIPPRGGLRLERLALVAKPRYEGTELKLRSRTDGDKPLVGYEIHRRLDNTSETELVGLTDEHGAVMLAGQRGMVETYLVKNGKQLLARLPVVPGVEPTLTAHVADDDPRLAAEGFVAALSTRALDLVARREILAARIRARLKDGRAEEAQQLLDEFRRLSTRADLSRDLDRQRQQISSQDKVTQARLERVFNEGQKLLLLKPLSDDLLVQLTREVAAARSSGAQ